MSLLPEIVFRSVIVRGIRTLRNDPKLLDQLFRNLDQASLQDLRDFVLNSKFYIDVNYPRTDLILPAIIILLRSENESQAYLADTMGTDSVPDAFTYDSFEDSTLDILGGAASTSTTSGEGAVAYGPKQVLSAAATSVTINARDWDVDTFLIGQHTIHIVGGTGAGQVRKVVSNTQTKITVDVAWSTLPDTTSVFVVRRGASEVIGEPRNLYTREGASGVERLGGLYALSYQIQVITSSAEQTVYLHAILKALFTLARTFLEEQGIISMQLGATDFVPKSEYQPDFAYMRALNVSFQHPFDTFTELTGLASSFDFYLEGNTIDGVTVLSNTTIPSV